MKRLAFVLMFSLVIAALSLAVACSMPLSGPTMTPVPRTPRPTRTGTPVPTATGTLVPTPTPAAGVYIWEEFGQSSVQTECEEHPLDRRTTLSGSWDAFGVVTNTVISWCVIGATDPLNAVVSWSANFGGFSSSFSSAMDCSPTGWCTPQPTRREVAGTSYQPCDCGGNPCGAGYQADATYSEQVYPYVMATPSDTSHLNQYGLVLSGGAGVTDCGAHGWDWSVTITGAEDDWQPTPGPTPTPVSGSGECWITEVFSKQSGSGVDYNLRSGAGADDEFVEVACNPAQSIAGWTLGVDTFGEYEIEADNWTGPLKVFWLDQWSGYSAITTTLPLTSTIRLTDTLGSLVDSRAYQTLSYGNSYAATAWTNPDGVWWFYSPSPGWGGEYWPTATPTP